MNGQVPHQNNPETLINIRTATSDDTPGIQSLLKQLGYDIDFPSLHQKIHIYTQHPAYGIIVAAMPSSLLGCVSFVGYPSLILDRGCIHLDLLIVDEHHRRQGIGKRLLKSVYEWGIKNDYKTIELITKNHRQKDGTHDFYRHHGFQDQTMCDITYFSKNI